MWRGGFANLNGLKDRLSQHERNIIPHALHSAVQLIFHHQDFDLQDNVHVESEHNRQNHAKDHLVSRPAKCNPEFVILGVGRDMGRDEVVEALRIQNSALDEAEISWNIMFLGGKGRNVVVSLSLEATCWS